MEPGVEQGQSQGTGGMRPIPRGLGAGVERALGDVSVPAYVIDPDGILIWLNPAAERLVGDARGRRFTEVVTATDRPRAKDEFTKKIIGTVPSTDASVHVLRPDGSEARIEISSAPLRDGHKIVGVFGLVSRPPEKPARTAKHPKLTPREVEILRLFSDGASTDQIAEQLHIARETVRNHVRSILRKLEVHSRLEAMALARSEGILDD
jgi:PAS domain S-box-containing protein